MSDSAPRGGEGRDKAGLDEGQVPNTTFDPELQEQIAQGLRERGWGHSSAYTTATVVAQVLAALPVPESHWDRAVAAAAVLEGRAVPFPPTPEGLTEEEWERIMVFHSPWCASSARSGPPSGKPCDCGAEEADAKLRSLLPTNQERKG